MKGLLLKYNKVHNYSLEILSPKLSKICSVVWGDLAKFNEKMDLLPYKVVKDYLLSFGKVDFIVIGDVFWKTGQNICRVCKEEGITVFFLQHGQWIYISNKKKLDHYPDHTLMFGDGVGSMCSSWEYGKNSKVSVVGCPRYDDATSNGNGNPYIYFSPPVIEEMIHGEPTGRIRTPFLNALKRMSGIDKKTSLVIQPHYREARVDILKMLFPRAQFADPQLDALKLVKGSSKVMASRNSTVVLDAMAHYKMVVLTDFPENDACFFKRGYFGEFALESDNKKHLVENLNADVDIRRTGYVSRARKYIYLGNASNRIAELVQREGIIQHVDQT